MALNMVDPYQWKLLCISNCLRLSNAHKKCTYKSRTISDTNCIQIIKSYICICQCLFNYLVNLFNMFTGSNLRDYSAV